MSTTVTRNWNLLLRNENNVTRVYYYGYDKNDLFINSFVDLSQSIIYSGYTDTYMLEQFILPALNAAISDINLTIPNTNNYLTGNSNNDNYYLGSLQNNDRLTSCKLMCISLVQTVTHTDVESVDYTNILTDININLTNLNTNITNKNNQSDIVDCLNNIFCYLGNNNAKISAFKYSTASGDVAISNLNLCELLYNVVRLLCNKVITVNDLYNGLHGSDFSNFSDISKKLSLDIPNSDYMYNQSIRKLLYGIYKALSNTDNLNNVGNLSNLKSISDKLANSNDLHTISQAIDLISTAIAQTPTTDVSGLTSAVQNLKLEQNNLIQVEGDIDYRIKYDKDKEE